MSTAPSSITPPTGLPPGFGGRVVAPGDADYDRLRRVVSGAVDHRPAAILRPGSAADVALAIGHARDAGLPLAVRSGGHSGAGHGSAEGGIVIDVRDLRAIEFDTSGDSVWAGAGLTAGELLAEVTGRGMILGFGDAASVGISGITLGGGVGYLVRKHGLTIDNLLAAEIVTADRKVRTVDAGNEPDLFWAIRGGGGNFGVVTRLKYKLHPLPAFTGGMLILPATAETVSGFIAAAEAAPEELSTIANVMPAPPMPFLPEAVHGKMIIMAMLAFAGPDKAAQAALAPFRALAKPLADMVKPGSFMQMYPPEDDSMRPVVAIRTFFTESISRDAAGKVVDMLGKGDAPMRVVQLRVLGGAADRVAPDATAYAHRGRRILGGAVAFAMGPADIPAKQKWVTKLAGLMTGDGAPGAYVNFLGDEGAERVREAYPGATFERLRDVKRRYDPENLFRLNQNIPPA